MAKHATTGSRTGFWLGVCLGLALAAALALGLALKFPAFRFQPPRIDADSTRIGGLETPPATEERLADPQQAIDAPLLVEPTGPLLDIDVQKPPLIEQ